MALGALVGLDGGDAHLGHDLRRGCEGGREGGREGEVGNRGGRRQGCKGVRKQATKTTQGEIYIQGGRKGGREGGTYLEDALGERLAVGVDELLVLERHLGPGLDVPVFVHLEEGWEGGREGGGEGGREDGEI